MAELAKGGHPPATPSGLAKGGHPPATPSGLAKGGHPPATPQGLSQDPFELSASPRQPLVFGGAPIGGLYEPVSDADAAATLAAAWDAGIRAFDTAPHYGVGLSEQRLGDYGKLRLLADPREPPGGGDGRKDGGWRPARRR